MKLRSIREVKNLQGKKVLMRVDFNVPLTKGPVPKVADDTKILAGLSTINYLLKKKAIIIMMAHLDSPGGKVVKDLSFKPVVKRLEKLLGKKVFITDDCLGETTGRLINKLKPGQLVMLENLRFYPDEEINSKLFAKKLASYGDIYVNEAFPSAHRRHASVVAVTNFLPSYAGLKLEKEIGTLRGVLKGPKRPLVAVIGGVKISTKLGVIRTLLSLSDSLLLGGALANTVLKAQGVTVGKSIVEEEMVKKLKKLKLTDTHLHIPIDVVVADKISPRAAEKIKAVGNITDQEFILDIGPDTVRLFDCIIREAGTIIWSGPMGMFEYPKFSLGTEGVIHAILHSRAKIVIGGGETIEAVKTLKGFMHFNKPNIYISTGGGAMLEFLEGKILPGIKPLIKK